MWWEVLFLFHGRILDTADGVLAPEDVVDRYLSDGGAVFSDYLELPRDHVEAGG